MPDELKPSSPAQVQRLVGQLRELLAKVHEAPLLYDTCVIASEAWRDKNGMIHYESYGGPLAEGDPRTLRLCVAAINALPALLAIAEAAEAILVCGDLHWHTPQADRCAREHDLRTALSSLPNSIVGQRDAAQPLLGGGDDGGGR